LVVLPFYLKTTEIYIFCIHLGLKCILSVICVFLCILWYWLYLYVFSLYWLASKGSYFCIFSFSPSQEVCLLCASKEFNWTTLVFLVTQYKDRRYQSDNENRKSKDRQCNSKQTKDNMTNIDIQNNTKKIEQHEPHQTPRVNSCALEGVAVSDLLLALVVCYSKKTQTWPDMEIVVNTSISK
jgi:hypothetical protein